MKDFKHLDPQEWKQFVLESNAQIIDVRSAIEHNENYIKNSLNIDVNTSAFANDISKLNPDTSYAVYCRSGARSARAMELMKSMGFKSVNNLAGGIMAWDYKGFEVEYSDDF